MEGHLSNNYIVLDGCSNMLCSNAIMLGDNAIVLDNAILLDHNAMMLGDNAIMLGGNAIVPADNAILFTGMVDKRTPFNVCLVSLIVSRVSSITYGLQSCMH